MVTIGERLRADWELACGDGTLSGRGRSRWVKCGLSRVGKQTATSNRVAPKKPWRNHAAGKVEERGVSGWGAQCTMPSSIQVCCSTVVLCTYLFKVD